MMFGGNKKSSSPFGLQNMQTEFALSPMTAEQQKRKLNLAVSAVMRSLNLPETNRADVRSAYVIAEDLALRQIEIDYKIPFLRHKVIEGVPFDGAALRAKTLLCAEVEFLTAAEIAPERLSAIFEKADYAVQRLQITDRDAKFLLILVLVVQLSPHDEAIFHERLKQQITVSAPVEVDAPIFNFEKLQSTFLS